MVSRFNFLLIVVVVALFQFKAMASESISYENKNEQLTYREKVPFYLSKSYKTIEFCSSMLLKLEKELFAALSGAGILTNVNYYKANSGGQEYGSSSKLFCLKFTKPLVDTTWRSFLTCSYAKLVDDSYLSRHENGIQSRGYELDSVAYSLELSPSISNVEVLGTRLGVCLKHNLSLTFSYNYLKKVAKNLNTNRALQTKKLAMGDIGKNSSGQELTFVLDYQYMPSLNLLVKSGYFPKGNHLLNNPNEDVTVIEGNIVVSF